MSSTGLVGRLVHRGEDGERGAILLIAAASLTLLVFAAALAIDIGGRAEEQTNDQKIADLAALDAVRVLPTDPTVEASSSADRNGYASLKSPTITPVEGTWDNGIFTPTSTSPNAVKVTITSVYNDFFGGGSPTLTGTAIALDEGEASFEIGSTLISIDAFNKLLAVFGSNLTLSGVGYNGILSGTSTLGALQSQLGLSALSPSQLLATNVTVAQLATAAGNILTNSPDGSQSGAALTALGAAMASGTVNSQAEVPLGSILGPGTLDSGYGSALATNVNLLSLIAGGLELANGEAGASLPLAVTIPGVTSATASITGIVPAVWSGYGPPNDPGVTENIPDTQVTMSLDVTMNVSVPSLPGLGGVVTVTLPMTVILGQASGTMTAINCVSGATLPTSITISTSFQDLNIAVGNAAEVTALSGSLSSTLTGSIAVPSKTVGPTNVAYPTNFYSDGTAVPVNSSYGSPNANLTATGQFSSATPTIDTAVDGVVAQAIPALGSAASQVLGISVGNADLLGGPTDQPGGPNPTCDTPRLVQ